MKTRNGFVSNSSSSSFVIVGTNEAFEKAMAEFRKGNLPGMGDNNMEKAEWGREFAHTLEGLRPSLSHSKLDIAVVVGIEVDDHGDEYSALRQLAEYCHGRDDILAIRE